MFDINDYEKPESGKKYRSWCIVVHNVSPDSRDGLIKVLGPCVEYTASVEEYPHQPGGYHCHMFVRYPNQRHPKGFLKELKTKTKKFVVPVPPGETRDWGRVQLRVMKGTMDQAHKYLTDPVKDKPVGDAKRSRNSRFTCRTCGLGLEDHHGHVTTPEGQIYCMKCRATCPQWFQKNQMTPSQTKKEDFDFYKRLLKEHYFPGMHNIRMSYLREGEGQCPVYTPTQNMGGGEVCAYHAQMMNKCYPAEEVAEAFHQAAQDDAYDRLKEILLHNSKGSLKPRDSSHIKLLIDF